MRFKNPPSKVMWLVITVILHSATAQYDPITIETLMNHTLEKFEQKIMEKLQAQHQEVIEKFAAHVTSVQQMENNTDDLLAGQLKIQKQLTKVTNDLHHSTPTLHKELANLISNLRNITDNLLHPSQTNVGKQLTDVKNELNQSTIDVFPPSCATLNFNETGTYYIRPAGVVEPFLVLCDFNDNYELGGGWTVFQRRFNGSVDFYQNWTMYKNGFGDVNGEHWLGLEKLRAITRSGRHELLILLEDHDGKTAYALYDSFHIASEAEKYKLTVGNYSGTAGGDSLSYHNQMKFSTFDEDNDNEESSCAQDYRGAWWFHHCYYSHLNARYFKKGEHFEYSVVWSAWKGIKYSLKSTKMMVRRRSLP